MALYTYRVEFASSSIEPIYTDHTGDVLAETIRKHVKDRAWLDPDVCEHELRVRWGRDPRVCIVSPDDDEEEPVCRLDLVELQSTQ